METWEEVAKAIITDNTIKNPARIRKMAWGMIDDSLRTTLHKVTEMYLNDEINKAEYEMTIDIISLAMRKINLIHS